MKKLSIDVETFSATNLISAGLYKYVEDPYFEILLFAYSIDDGQVEIIDLAQGEELPQNIIDALTNASVEKHAFNAQFERVCLAKHLKTHLSPPGWYCSMVHALSLGLPRSLKDVGEALNLPQDTQKLYTGKNLIRLFSVPRKNKTLNRKSLFPEAGDNIVGDNLCRLLPKDKPEEWEQFKDYCKQDVVAEMAIQKKLNMYPLPETEQALYWLDQEINDRGVRIDRRFVEQANSIDTLHTQALQEEFVNLSGLDNPNSLPQLKAWIQKRTKREVTAITKATLPELIKEFGNSDKEVARALELRQELSKTSTAKYAKMIEVMTEPPSDSAHGLLQFYGAGTGRWAGRLVQIQNLPRSDKKLTELKQLRDLVSEGDKGTLELMGPVPDILSELIRTAFIPSSGCRFIVSDFSAIEARVIAWYAKEQWRIDVFNSHGKIYEAAASQMFNVPIGEITKDSPLRQKGKVAELACGYAGSVGALKAMGALKMGLKEEELPELITQWRQASPNICQFWYDVNSAAKKAITDKTTVITPQGVALIYAPGVLFVEIASGRRLAYPNPKIEPHHVFQGTKITFSSYVNGRWDRADTYGGKLVENIVQATARDCLADAMFRLEKAGYKIAFHVHDEVVLDTPVGEGSIEEVNAILSEKIPWAVGLNLKAAGFETDFYMKD